MIFFMHFFNYFLSEKGYMQLIPKKVYIQLKDPKKSYQRPQKKYTYQINPIF